VGTSGSYRQTTQPTKRAETCHRSAKRHSRSAPIINEIRATLMPRTYGRRLTVTKRRSGLDCRAGRRTTVVRERLPGQRLNRDPGTHLGLQPGCRHPLAAFDQYAWVPEGISR